jgi:methylmalonyl-CoA mutase cobalamin-binding subunit
MIVTREELCEWVVDALKARGGASTVVGVAKHIWDRHEKELRQSGDRFYTWQYDIRWAAKQLRDQGVLKPVKDSKTLPWELANPNN